MQVILLAMYVRGADAVGLQLIEWVRIMRRQGPDVTLVVERLETDVPEDIRESTIVQPSNPQPDIRFWNVLKGADLVICDYPAHYRLAETLRQVQGAAILFSYHGVTPPALWPDATGRAYLEQSRRRAALVHFAGRAVTRSEYTRQELHHLTGYPLERIDVIPCIVPPPAALPIRPARAHKPLVLSVGRLAAHKQPRLLVEAVALARRSIPDIQLVFAGDVHGPSHTPVLREVRRCASTLGIAEAVHYTGLIDNDLLEHLYQQADLLVSASLHEGFGIPLVEAMARGVPVVAVNSGALRETVGDAGILVDPGDAAALSSAMLKVLQEPQTRRQLVERGYERAKQYLPASVELLLNALLLRLPSTALRRRGLPRLGQLTDLETIHSAAEIGLPFPKSVGRWPILSPLLAGIRHWVTSDIRRQMDQLTQGQVDFNRRVAQALLAIDELSATTSEEQAARSSTNNM